MIKMLASSAAFALGALTLAGPAMPVAAAPPLPALMQGQNASQCPADAKSYQGTGATVTCYCPQSAVRSGGTVWGSDIYTDDSSICRAARHSGAVDANGGNVTFTMMPGQQSYPGSTRNGVATNEYGSWNSSFRFGEAPGYALADGTRLAVCPGNASQWRASDRIESCYCTSTAIASQNNVWGTDIYTDDSHICRAARHMGAVSANGGAITVTMMPGEEAYRATTRNGISSNSYGRWSSSFRVAPAE
ncbi:MAG: LCCL domain-containing protein [Blastomonas sp.]